MIKGKYTVVLKTLMDNPDTKKALEEAMSTYPLYVKKSKEEFCPSYIPTREELNNKILNHYKYREIGFETVGRFLDELKISLEEIMPYYNQLFFSHDQDINILFNVDYSKEIKRNREDTNENTTNESGETSMKTTETNSAESSSTGTNSSSATDSTTTTASVDHHNKNVQSATPQGLLSIGTTDIDSVQYADEMSFNHDVNTDNGTSNGSSSSESSSELSGTTDSEMTNDQAGTSKSNITSNGKNNENENIIETTKGNFGVVSSQDLIMKYRELIINIEQQIINDKRISELFMNVW